MKLSEKLKFAMDKCDPKYGISVHQSFIKELEALENETIALEEQLKEFDMIYTELQRALKAIHDHEEVKYAHDELVKTYLAITDAGSKIKILEERLNEWDEERVPRLGLVGELIRGDWSGTEFDGRDVRDWIDIILSGNYAEFDDEVKPYAEDYNLYNEIIAKKELRK